jgi:UDP-N-acetylglucosamine 2-epimerase (non-hydrolysing)
LQFTRDPYTELTNIHMFKILTVVGTRPNFIKITQFNRLFNTKGTGIEHKVVHTGQHYDDKMSKIFFEQFALAPDYYLNIESGTPNSQIARIMTGLETVINEFKPDLMMVVGDVNSTLAASLTANKVGIKLAHVESGLRSGDRTMPEEINRILTDEVSDYCFVTEQSGYDNLLQEGKTKEQIFFVGNTMIDTLVAFDPCIMASDILKESNLEAGKFVLMTMHRPATVDHKEGVEKLVEVIKLITSQTALVFPIHPRTLANIGKLGFKDEFDRIPGLVLMPPLEYFAFQKLVATCRYVITDSGGIQEETTFRQIPCITLRPNTERPVTCTMGTNTLAGFDLAEIEALIRQINDGEYKKGVIPPLWDGNSSTRILEHVLKSIK